MDHLSDKMQQINNSIIRKNRLIKIKQQANNNRLANRLKEWDPKINNKNLQLTKN